MVVLLVPTSRPLRERNSSTLASDSASFLRSGSIVVESQDEALRDVPVILLTAKADEETKLNLLVEGAQDYVLKPFSIDELRARVRNQLQTKLTRDTLRRALDSSSGDLASMVKELAAARTTAVAANAAKDDFLAVLSHELAHFSGGDTTHSRGLTPMRAKYAQYLNILEGKNNLAVQLNLLF